MSPFASARPVHPLPYHPLALAVASALSLVLAPVARAAGEPATLPEVTVADTPLPREGTADQGYRFRGADLGPLGRRDWQETPYTINSISSELMQNYGVETFSEATRFLPSTYVEGHFGLEIGPPVIRGLQGDDVAGSVRIDGLNVRADVPLPLELYERLEVLNGPAAALYGPAPAAGTLNSRLKRPTDTPLREIGVGLAQGGNAQVRADLGGRLGEGGVFGYRLNLLQADGGGYTDGSKLHRALQGLALDARPGPDTRVELLASHYEFDQKGYPGAFVYNNSTGLPSAPDPERAGYGQAFGGVNATIDLRELHLDHQLGEGWRVQGAVLNQVATRFFMNAITNTLQDAQGDYKTTYRQSGSRSEVLSNAFSVNGEVRTGTWTHALSLGTQGYQIDNDTVPGLRTATSALTLGSASLDNPVSWSDPGWGGTGPRYRASTTRVQSLTLGDTLSHGPWSLLATANDSWIHARNWNASGATTSTYDMAGRWSYAGSLLYRLRPELTVYGSVTHSLQPGDVAPSTAANAGQGLAPYRSKGWEVGSKLVSEAWQGALALFGVRRPFAYTDANNLYQTAGEQENQGVEFTLRGQPTAAWVVGAALTGLDPRMKSAPSTAAQNGLVVGVPRWQGNLLAEYHLAPVPGLTLEGSAHYLGRRAANLENTLWAPATTTFDLGARLESSVSSAGGQPKRFTTRLMVANVTNRHYWASLYTGSGWSGGTGANGTAFLAEPRTLRLTVTANF